MRLKDFTTRALVLIAMFLSVTVHSLAYDFESDDIYYNIMPNWQVSVTHGPITWAGEDDGEFGWGLETAIGYYHEEEENCFTYSDVYNKNVTIPSTVTYNGKTYQVTAIGDHAFENGKLRSVSIPNSVTSIGRAAFLNCVNLNNVTFPDNVTSISDSTFFMCSRLTSFTISGSVTSIGRDAFCRCKALHVIDINATSLTSIGSGAFDLVYDYSKVETVNLNSIASWLKVSLGGASSSPFNGGADLYVAGEKITTISFPFTTTSIPDYAFYGCRSITSVTIPAPVANIGTRAFRRCSSLTAIDVNSSNSNYSSEDGILYNANKTKLLVCPTAKTGAVSIPQTVTAIRESALTDCAYITSVTIPNSVTTIGDRAFFSGDSRYVCGLTDVYCYAEAVPSTGSLAFYDSKIASATLHVPAASLQAYRTTYPWSRFGTIVAIDDTPIIAFADANVKALCVANWDTNHDGELSEAEAAAVTSLGSVFKGNTTITSFNELQYFTGLTEIDDYAFQKAVALTSVIIPQNVTRIGKEAFANWELGASHLTTVQLPEGLTDIDDKAFWECDKLNNINIPSTLKHINQSAFHDTAIESLTFPEGLEKIGYSAFNFCNSLTSIYIPSTVNEIGFASFVDCPRISSIVVAESNPMYDSRSNCNAIIETSTNTLIQGCQSSTIPEGVTSIGEAAFQGCKYGLTSVTIPNGITNIGSGAFCGCDFLEYVSIPMSVTSIGTYAFYQAFGLTNLKEVYCYASTPPEAYIYCPEPVIDEYDYLPEGDHYAFNIDYLRLATLHVPAASLEAYSTTAPWSYFGSIVAIDDTPIITFADANVKALCVANWDTNHDGELSEAEAAAVTDLGEVFSGNTTITSFNELQYFTGLTGISYDAFSECSNLTSIIIPNGVTNIGGYVFSGCTSLTSIQVETGNTTYDSRDNCNAIIKTATNTLIAGCQNTTIPNSVTSIGYEAFYGCSSLTSITIPNSVTSIGNSAFAWCSGLTSITIPNSVTSIGNGAFWGCYGLTSITIPGSVTSIGGGAFM